MVKRAMDVFARQEGLSVLSTAARLDSRRAVPSSSPPEAQARRSRRLHRPAA